MKSEISLFVVSDLHVYSLANKSEPKSPSALKAILGKKLSETDEVNPAASLLRFIRKESITADYLVCCGDFTDRADKVGLIAAWEFIQELKIALRARELVCTLGNHDVFSRKPSDQSVSNPFDHVKELHPQFPFEDETLFDRYWARNFVLRTTSDCQFLILNTCSSHGYANEYRHGRVSKWTREQIKGAISKAKKRDFLICVCHHHPHKHEELQLGDYDDIKQGQLLLETLEAHGSWLVIHGHKHHPKLIYAQGSSRSPVVFSAGSMAAEFNGAMQGKIRNQCYRITIKENRSTAAPPCGAYTAWTWTHAGEWTARPDYFDLPHEGGFGCRDRAPIVRKTMKLLKKRSVISWQELATKVPEVRYLVPKDVEHFLEDLKFSKVRFQRKEEFYPRELQL